MDVAKFSEIVGEDSFLNFKVCLCNDLLQA